MYFHIPANPPPNMACKRRRWRGPKPAAFFMRVACRRVVPSIEAASGALEAQRWAVHQCGILAILTKSKIAVYLMCVVMVISILGVRMKYGQVSENENINATIYHCLTYLSEKETLKFVRKFREQPHDQDQVMHTFRELILGAYLSKSGFLVENDYKIKTKTPDWCIFNDNYTPKCILELVNFHLDADTSKNIEIQFRERGFGSYFSKSNTNRLYFSIKNKVGKYKEIALSSRIPYVVAVSGAYMADVQVKEIEECLLNPDWGIFYLYPELSGLLYFEEINRDYVFTYRLNMQSVHNFVIPSGIFEKYASDSDE